MTREEVQADGYKTNADRRAGRWLHRRKPQFHSQMVGPRACTGVSHAGRRPAVLDRRSRRAHPSAARSVPADRPSRAAPECS